MQVKSKSQALRRPLRWVVALGAAALIGPLAQACTQPPGGGSGSDAGIDSGVLQDAAPPLRRLVQGRLFGASPVENRFVDPTFSLVDGVSWSPYNFATGQLSLTSRAHLRTPEGLPAMRLLTSGSQPATLLGQAKAPVGPALFWIWFGRTSGPQASDPVVRLIGLYADGQAAAEILPDETMDSIVLDGVKWTRWAATMAEPPMGWVTLRVVNRDEQQLYISAPTLVSASKAGAKAKGRPARIVPLTAEERADLAGYWRQILSRFRSSSEPSPRRY